MDPGLRAAGLTFVSACARVSCGHSQSTSGVIAVLEFNFAVFVLAVGIYFGVRRCRHFARRKRYQKTDSGATGTVREAT